MNRKSLGKALRWLAPISVLLAGLWVLTPVGAQSGSAAPSAQRKTSIPYTGDLSIFDTPGRDERLQINRVMDMLGIAPGKNVADIGAGSGWFTVRAARRVTASGTVYAADINPEAIRYIDQRAKKEQLPNVKTILSQPDDPQLPLRQHRRRAAAQDLPRGSPSDCAAQEPSLIAQTRSQDWHH